MKHHQIWLNKVLKEENTEAFKQAILVISEPTWRAALEWVLPVIERLGQEACYDIEDELRK